MIKLGDFARIYMTCIAGIFGVRTPPEPDVIPHMAPVKGPEGSDGGRAGDTPEGHTVVLPPRRASAPSPAGYTLDLPAELEVSFRADAQRQPRPGSRDKRPE